MSSTQSQMKPFGDVVDRENNIDSPNSTSVPKMDLLKVNYVHQCKNAIIHKSNDSPLTAQRYNPNPFGGYRRQLKNIPIIEDRHRNGQNRSSNSSRILLENLKMPKADSWQELTPQDSKFKTYTNDTNYVSTQCAVSSASNLDNLETVIIESNVDDICDCKISRNWKSHNDCIGFPNAVVGVISRKDRIARIENKRSSSHRKSATRIPKPNDARDNHSIPEWMFKNPGTGERNGSNKCSSIVSITQPKPSSRLQQIIMFGRVHMNDQPLKRKTKLPEASSNESYECSMFSKLLSKEDRNKESFKDNLSINSISDPGFSANKKKRSQQRFQTIKDGDSVNDDYNEKQLLKERDEIDGLLQIKGFLDHNDLQNFSNKNLTKMTTNELLSAATANNKKCNIDLERRLNNFQIKGEEQQFDDIWNNEICHPHEKYFKTDSHPPSIAKNSPASIIFMNGKYNDSSKFPQSTRSYSVELLSSDSVSLSGCSGSCLENSSQCDSDEDCFECNHNQNVSKLINDLPKDFYNTDEGIFWNNAYDDIPMETCSLSCTDKNDCLHLDENLSENIKPISVQEIKASGLVANFTRSQMFLLKANDKQDWRTRRSNGIPSLEITDQQNQQDTETRCLKRGHVLKELLETERIYVNEMGSILKGYSDRLKSEVQAPASLQGKEDILFGNLKELYRFHCEVFLKDLENCISATELVALCFVQRRDTFYQLYSFYCQNIPRSERLRETLVDTHIFLQECQKRLGHKLPLAAYLLKPVQRITKYQLLLKDLLRFSDSGSCSKELQKALDCMLIVLKCVNDSMHQVAITGFPGDVAQQGELLMQDSFQVWTESKKDIRLRIKPQQRHIFLYQKSMLFCKETLKPGHNKSTYQFKNHVKMSQIGLTESVRGDTKRFEVWLQGRQEVHTLQAPSVDIKQKWVAEIKRVLFNQLEELKGEKIKQYGINQQDFRQTTFWDSPSNTVTPTNHTIYVETLPEASNLKSKCSSDFFSTVTELSDKDQQQNCSFSLECSNSEEELAFLEESSSPGDTFVVLADYSAMTHSEVAMREGDTVELLKVGCAGWWYVRTLDTNAEGWAPAAYMEHLNRKSERVLSRHKERINFKQPN